MKIQSPIKLPGGKGNLQGWLQPLIPQGRVYCEACLGTGGVLLNRAPSECEYANDLNSNVVSLFRILQDPELSRTLERRARMTLCHQDEYALALRTLKSNDATTLDRAWAFMVTQLMGFGGIADSVGSFGTTRNSDRGMAGCVASWMTRLTQFPAWITRLQRVQFWQEDCVVWIDRMARLHGDDMVLYVDPPYHPAVTPSYYEHAVDHDALLRQLLVTPGAVVISGYRHESYQVLTQAGWECLERETVSHMAGKTAQFSHVKGPGGASFHRKRIECVWRNPLAIELSTKPGKMYDLF